MLVRQIAVVNDGHWGWRSCLCLAGRVHIQYVFTSTGMEDPGVSHFGKLSRCDCLDNDLFPLPMSVEDVVSKYLASDGQESNEVFMTGSIYDLKFGAEEEAGSGI